MIKVVTATEAKNRFGDIIRRAYMGEEHLIVQRDGIPVVAIVPMTDYERLINPADLPDEISGDVQASVKAVRARARLLDVLNAAQREAPRVQAKRVEEDVMHAIREVRSGRSK